MRLAITFLATFVWIAVGNAITHGVLGAKLMARALSVLGSAARPPGGFPAWLLEESPRRSDQSRSGSR
jgi:hypothetical protein